MLKLSTRWVICRQKGMKNEKESERERGREGGGRRKRRIRREV
jgi:hypothetical protein